MADTRKLLRDIHTLRELIQIDWEELYSNPLREEERREIRNTWNYAKPSLSLLSNNWWGWRKTNQIRTPRDHASKCKCGWPVDPRSDRFRVVRPCWALASRHPHPASSHHPVIRTPSDRFAARNAPSPSPYLSPRAGRGGGRRSARSYI